ncbi:BnaAnng06060D [Brassica napus]|uniref:BnaAnng06060D protein n=1 Tax=Brassica napus TaxID=3708 RepID=A0A078HVE5_BRANA|nr:BnaAnng06060D [Brassica napus]
MSLFGAKTILRIKVYDLLEKHYEENQDDADFDYLYEDEAQIVSRSEKVVKIRKVVEKKPRGTFAKMVSENVKMVYLRKSLVQELVKKSQEGFEGKVLGSFVRIRSDPNDYLQKNPYQLVQVTGVKKEPGTDGFLLQVTNCVKDVSISMLSDDDFSKEECEDLHQRIKNGSLKQPTIVEMEEKARSLHEEQTKHWLGRELASLQKRIAQATEKGWRREYPFIRLNIIRIYLEKRELLQTPEEQSRLLREVPEVIGEELVPSPEASPEAHKSDNEQRLSESPISSIQETPEVRNLFGGDDQQCNNGFLMSNTITTPGITSHAVDLPTWTASAGDGYLHRDVEQTANGIHREEETPTKEPEVSQLQSSTPVLNHNNGSQAQPNPSEIIELSDGDEDENCGDGETLDPTVEHVQVLSSPPSSACLSEKKRKRDRRTPYDREKASWLYKDPQGDIQGPFSLTELKAWNDADYFYKGFKVWMTGQSVSSAVLLTDVLRQVITKGAVTIRPTTTVLIPSFCSLSLSLLLSSSVESYLELGSGPALTFTCCLSLLSIISLIFEYTTSQKQIQV